MDYGKTPMIEVGGVFAKLECTNPTGSVKDRIAKYIIDESEKRGLLKPGMKIVEATSGNTGIAFAYYAVKKGYKIAIVMPANMSEERKQIIKGLGAELILCGEGDFLEAVDIRDKIAESPQYFNPNQFSNPLNTECHYNTTGQEIIKQIQKYRPRVDAFVAGVGTGGTLMGVAFALKKKNPSVYIAGVEPLESPVMNGGKAGVHGIFGIGDGFIPTIVSNGKDGFHKIIDEVICISTEEAIKAANEIQQNNGYCVGISSGANYRAAQRLAGRFQTVVTVFADGYTKYMSHGLKHCAPGQCQYEKHHDVLDLIDKNNTSGTYV